MAFGNGRGIDDQTAVRLLAGSRNRIDILCIMDEHALFLQLLGEGAGGLVVTGYHKAFLDEITGDGTHADATGSYEIYCVDIFHITYQLSTINYQLSISECANLMTSLAIMSAELGSAIFRMFS